MSRAIPVYLLTGFLGAGKTTLLQSLLRHEKSTGRRPAVLMNEFGKASVDTLLLENASVPVVDLIEGCVCCTVRGSLTTAMTQLLEQYEPDVVFLEATGVAIPLEIIDALLEQPIVKRVKIAGVFTLVDATQFPVHLPPIYEQTVVQQTMVEQVRHADVLLLSKTDIARPDRRYALESFLRSFNQKAPLVKVVKGAVDAASLLDIRTQFATSRAEKSHHVKRVRITPGHFMPRTGSSGNDTLIDVTPSIGESGISSSRIDSSHSDSSRIDSSCNASSCNASSCTDSSSNSSPRKVGRVVPVRRPLQKKTSFGQLQTLHYEFRAAVDSDRFYEFLRALPETVLRGKGFYRDAGSGQIHEFHFVPHTPMTTPVTGITPQEMFAIFIGEQLDEQDLRRKLRACEVE